MHPPPLAHIRLHPLPCVCTLQIKSEEIDLERIALVDPAIALVAADLLDGMGIKVCPPRSRMPPAWHRLSITTAARRLCGDVCCCLRLSCPCLQGGIARKILKILHGTPEPATNGG